MGPSEDVVDHSADTGGGLRALRGGGSRSSRPRSRADPRGRLPLAGAPHRRVRGTAQERRISFPSRRSRTSFLPLFTELPPKIILGNSAYLTYARRLRGSSCQSTS